MERNAQEIVVLVRKISHGKYAAVDQSGQDMSG